MTYLLFVLILALISLLVGYLGYRISPPAQFRDDPEYHLSHSDD